jgi:thiopurine S-methyltransferase
MQPQFWHDRWQTGQIGFHLPTVHPFLSKYWRSLPIATAGRVLVPLCGKSLDLLWLRDAGYSVVGVELSTIAVEAFCMENGVPARRRILDGFDSYESPNLQLLRGDFFATTAELLGPISAIYDRAALISWAPELRAGYVAHLTQLIAPGTPILLITMEYPQEHMSGPPFSVSRNDIETLCSSQFAIEELERQDVLANEPRLQARGLTRLFEVSYRLTRC